MRVIAVAVFCLFEWTASHLTNRSGVSEICKRQTIDPGPNGLNLSSGGKLFISDRNGNFADPLLVQRWTDFENPTFVGVVQPATEGDIINTIKFANKFKIPVLPLGGTHGYAATLSKVQNGIAIDLRTNFKSITVNAAANTVTVGGAALIKDLVDITHAAGKQIPTGTCPCVGVLGAALGGGIGRLQGLHGLMSDNLVSARVILANGQAVTVSASQSSDLYWAMRGAGHNFGVVTQATFKTYPAPNGGKHVLGDLIFTPDKIKSFFAYVNNNPLPAPLSVFALYLKLDAGEPVMFVNIVYAGPEAQGRDLIAQYAAIGAVSTTVSLVPWNKLSDVAGGGLGNAVCGRGNRKNMFGLGLKTYNPDAMLDIYNSFADILRTNPDLATSAITMESFPVQGVQAIADSASAYPHRDINHHILINLVYTQANLDTTVTNFGKSLRSKFLANTGFSTAKTYMNYGHGDESLATLYGQSKLQTLTATKKKYDPDGVFNGYHALPRA